MVLCLKVRNKIMRGRVLRSFVPVNVVCLGNLHICASPSSNVSSSLYYLKLTPPPTRGPIFADDGYVSHLCQRLSCC